MNKTINSKGRKHKEYKYEMRLHDHYQTTWPVQWEREIGCRSKVTGITIVPSKIIN